MGVCMCKSISSENEVRLAMKMSRSDENDWDERIEGDGLSNDNVMLKD